MIEGINICKRYGELELFNNLSFTIESGEFVCFSGESGKGKTTLLNMIGMIEQPSSGKILIDGNELCTNKDKMNFFREKVGFVFQNFALVDGKTVKQNIELVRKSNRNNISVEEALRCVGLEDRINDKIYTLSGGEQQRVALARLFIKKCDIILADEPTGSLDSYNANTVINILRQLNEGGKTVVIVTHDDNVKAICNRIIPL